jgi:hypothetical protein
MLKKKTKAIAQKKTKLSKKNTANGLQRQQPRKKKKKNAVGRWPRKIKYRGYAKPTELA